MRYGLLGKTGLRVSEICPGTLTFDGEWDHGASREESRMIFEAFWEAGCIFTGTANRYRAGTSEEYIGEFIKAKRERSVVSKKIS